MEMGTCLLLLFSSTWCWYKKHFHHLRVHEFLCIHNATALEFSQCFLIRWLQCSICSHELHYVIWIFHAKYMIIHLIFHLLHCINIYQTHRRKVGINFITLYILCQYLRFLMISSQNTPFFQSFTKPFVTQKPLSIITTFAQFQIGLVHHIIVPTVLPISSNSGLLRSRGRSPLPLSLKSTWFSTTNKQWYASHYQMGKAYVQHISKQYKYTYLSILECSHLER